MRMLFFALAMAASAANAADTAEAIIENCWKGHDHPGMSSCVVARAADAEKKLSSTQQAILTLIDKTRSERGLPGYQREARSTIRNANRTFEKYRGEQCGYLAAVAAKGNGAEDVRLACETSLNAGRAEQLKESLSSIQI
jgi:uncharacterized protein YecT (DUF1311 family)